MKHTDQLRPIAKRDGVIVEEVGDEIFVYDVVRLEAHSLNRAVGVVWKYSNGSNTIADMARLLATEIHSAADEHVVWYALERLREAHLLEQDTIPLERVNLLTRRELVGRLGKAAIAAVPVIASIPIPTAAQASSFSAHW